MRVEIDGQMYVPAATLAMADMPKLLSPFIRETVGNRRLVTPQIEPGYEWVFEDPDVLAVEKLDGTNVSVGIQGGQLVRLCNRLNPIPLGVLDGNRYIQGVRTAYGKGRVPTTDGQHFGELMGPGIQGNFLKLDTPDWYHFGYLRNVVSYRSWGKYPKDFDTISRWFRDDLFSLMYAKLHGDKVPPEGIVFWQPSTGRMAKLRRDMYDWYQGKGH